MWRSCCGCRLRTQRRRRRSTRERAATPIAEVRSGWFPPNNATTRCFRAMQSLSAAATNCRPKSAANCVGTFMRLAANSILARGGPIAGKPAADSLDTAGLDCVRRTAKHVPTRHGLGRFFWVGATASRSSPGMGCRRRAPGGIGRPRAWAPTRFPVWRIPRQWYCIPFVQRPSCSRWHCVSCPRQPAIPPRSKENDMTSRGGSASKTKRHDIQRQPREAA